MIRRPDLSISTAAVLFCASRVAPAHAEGGLPQLDTSMFPEQLFWLAICFVLLYALMSGSAMPRVARTQAKRERVIATELQAAHAANDTAKKTVAFVEASLAETRAKAQTGMAATLAGMEAEHAEKAARQERELARNLHRVESDIAVTREAAMRAVRAVAPELAQAIASRILRGGRGGA